MMQSLHELRELEGQSVFVELTDGSVIGGCTLISVRSGRSGTLWLYRESRDLFVPLQHLVAVWPRSFFDDGQVA